MDEFEFGKRKVNAASINCCGKPQGCTMTHDECLYLSHPAKRARLFGDTTVRCAQAVQQPHPETGQWVRWQCHLLNGHTGSCDCHPPVLHARP